MALMCEMIGGVLSGGNTIHPKYPRHKERILNSMTVILIDPARLSDDLGKIDKEILDLTEYMRDSPIRPKYDSSSESRILIPGEIEMINYEERNMHGIPVANGMDDLVAVAKVTGLTSIPSNFGNERERVHVFIAIFKKYFLHARIFYTFNFILFFESTVLKNQYINMIWESCKKNIYMVFINSEYHEIVRRFISMAGLILRLPVVKNTPIIRICFDYTGLHMSTVFIAIFKQC